MSMNVKPVRMKLRGLIPLILVLLTTLWLPTPRAEPLSLQAPQQAIAGEPSVSIWNPSQHSGNIADPGLAPGNEFTISINITDAPSFDSYSIRFEYNPSVLQVSGTDLSGSIFYPNITYSFVNPYLPGVVTATVYGSSFVSGSGILLDMRFTVMLSSVSNLKVVAVDLFLGEKQVTRLKTEGCFSNRPFIEPIVDFTTTPSPSYYQTSLYIVGRIAVGIILPESTGEDYNWTDAEVSQTVEGIRNAMAFWASQETSGNLSFYYNTQVRAPTSYEPIEMPLGQDSIWIQDVMNRMGYSGDAFTATLAYDNAIRAFNHTDWAFTIFVADSNSSINMGNFPDGQYAHAYIGGPSLTMARFSSFAYNSPQYFAAVPAHETGHIFGATDEYNGFPEYSGYLYVPDADGSFGLMNRNNLYVSLSTAAQVGLVDCDGNGRSDLLETKPAILLDTPPTTITSPTTIITGTAEVVPYPHYPSGPDVTVSKISTVEFNIDQGTPILATPRDGSFDQQLEHFSLNLTSLSIGEHTITVTTVTSAGKTALASFTVNVPTPVTGTASLIRWKAKPAYRYLDLSTHIAQLFLADANVTGGPTYVYLLFSVRGGTGSTYTVASPVTSLGLGETVLSTPWQPPALRARYTVHAAIYYSSRPLTQGDPGWSIGSEKLFTFIVAVASTHA